MVRKLVTLSLGALALAACGDTPTMLRPIDDTATQVPVETADHHVGAPVIISITPNSPGAGDALVTWAAGVNNNGIYDIELFPPTGPLQKIDGHTGTSYQFSGLATGAYDVRISARTSVGQTSHTGQTSKLSFSVGAVQADQSIQLTTPSSATFGDAPFTVRATSTSGLPITFSVEPVAVCIVSAATLTDEGYTATVTVLAAGTCAVTATQAGNAAWKPVSATNDVLIEKAHQTIQFDLSTLSKTYGDPAFTISATGGASGNPVTFASLTENRCTVSGSTVTIVGAGTCSIKASQAGNGNYEAAADVVSSFPIAKASQTISFDLSGVTATYGDAPFTISATGGASGNPVTFASQTPGTCTVTDDDVTIVGAGMCTIRASQAGNDNYLDAADVDRSVDIARAPLTITVVDADGEAYVSAIHFSDAVPAAALDIEGFVYDDDASDIGNPGVQWCQVNGVCTDVAGTPSAVGSYEAYPKPVVTSNYDVNVVRGSLVIQAWTLRGFFAPVDMNGIINSVKGGSTVPLKFEVFKGTEELTLTTAIKSFVSSVIACPGGSEDPVAADFLTTGGTTLRYDSVAGQFVQNWQTPKNPGKCYRVVMTTQDGSTLQALFRLK